MNQTSNIQDLFSQASRPQTTPLNIPDFGTIYIKNATIGDTLNIQNWQEQREKEEISETDFIINMLSSLVVDETGQTFLERETLLNLPQDLFHQLTLEITQFITKDHHGLSDDNMDKTTKN